MITKNNLYTIISITKDKILLVKNKIGQYDIPKETNIRKIKKNYFLSDGEYSIRKITSDKWYSYMNPLYKNKIRSLAKTIKYINAYLITFKELNYPSGEYIPLSELLHLSFVPSCYFYLFPILSNQLQLEDKLASSFYICYELEKKSSFDFDTWFKTITYLLKENSYVGAQRLNKIYYSPTKNLKYYQQQLYNQPDTSFLQQMNVILENTHSIYDTLFRKEQEDKQKYIAYMIKNGFCTLTELLDYKDSTHCFADILNYFKRTNDQETLWNYILYLIDQNKDENDIELTKIFQLNILQLNRKHNSIMANIYYGCYQIQNKNYQEALDVFSECYKLNNQNEKEFKPSILSLYTPYRSITNTYKYIILTLIKYITNLNLASISEPNLYQNFLHEYEILQDSFYVHKRPESIYLKKTLDLFRTYPSALTKGKSEKEKIIFLLKNMSSTDFKKLTTILEKNLDETTQIEIQNILYKNKKRGNTNH